MSFNCGKCGTAHFPAPCPKLPKTGPPSALDLRKLSIVAACMDNFLREENASFVGLTQLLNSQLDSADSNLAESAEIICLRNRQLRYLQDLNDSAERTIFRLRLERDCYAQRAWQLEQWLLPYLSSCEDLESLSFTRPRPPLSEQDVDEIIDLTTDDDE